jgi:hypothetical protein
MKSEREDGMSETPQNSVACDPSLGNGYSVFTSGPYKATAPNAAFPQEKPHFAALSCSE